MNKIIDIVKVKPMNNFFLEISFSDGVTKVVDIKPLIKNGISKQLENKDFFEKVSVQYGTIVWENGFDLCPVSLRNFV